MGREKISKIDLLGLINDRFKTSAEPDGGCRDISVSGCNHYANPLPGEGNWDIPSYNGPPKCNEFFAIVIQEIRLKYDLIGS